MNEPPVAQSVALSLLREDAERIRVRLAAERTLLAWIRTGLALMGFGFLVARFGLFMRQLVALPEAAVQYSPGMSLWLGTALVVLGVIVNLLAGIQHSCFLKEFGLQRLGNRARSSIGLWVSCALSILGAIMAVYLLSMG